MQFVSRILKQVQFVSRILKQVQSRHRVQHSHLRHRPFAIWLEGVGVALNPKNGKLLHNELEWSGVDNIYAIGNVLVTTGCVYVCTTVREDD